MAGTILLSARPTRLVFLHYYVLWIVLWIAALLVFVDAWHLIPDTPVPYIGTLWETLLALVLGFFGLVALLAAEVRRLGIHYLVMDDRVVRTDGIVRRRMQQMPYAKIERIQMSQGLLQRILRLGDIVIDTGEDTVLLESLRHVSLIHDEITKHMAALVRPSVRAGGASPQPLRGR